MSYIMTFSDRSALDILNRALDLYGLPAELTVAHAERALRSAEGRIDVDLDYSPRATALAEYLDLRGPWNEERGEHAGSSGYDVRIGDVA